MNFSSGKFVDFGLKPRHLLREGVGHAAERVAVDLDPGHLHLGQNRHQWAFQRLVDGRHLLAVQIRLERLPETQGDVGVLGGVFHASSIGTLVESDRRFSRPQQRFDRDRRVAR